MKMKSIICWKCSSLVHNFFLEDILQKKIKNFSSVFSSFRSIFLCPAFFLFAMLGVSQISWTHKLKIFREADQLFFHLSPCPLPHPKWNRYIMLLLPGFSSHRWSRVGGSIGETLWEPGVINDCRKKCPWDTTELMHKWAHSAVTIVQAPRKLNPDRIPPWRGKMGGNLIP